MKQAKPLAATDSSSTDFLHKEYPQQFARTDFWQQIKRTVNGQPVSEADIESIVRQVSQQLRLQPADQLLDLGCGNGALAARLFEFIDGYVGVDFSDYLLSIAEEFFLPSDRISYLQADMRDCDRYLPAAASANKVLIYGCISYLTRTEAEQLLDDLKRGMPRLESVFVGNVANANSADEFYATRGEKTFDLDDHTSAIGVWWTKEQFVAAAARAGYRAEVVEMPVDFYAARYRFDALLHPIHVASDGGLG